jgi:hypothetical protein
MPKLKEHLRCDDAAKRDQFFMDLYDKAETIVKQNGDVHFRTTGKQVIYGVAEVTVQLEGLLKQELVNEFSDPSFKQDGTMKMMEQALDWEPATTDPEEISKLAAEQQVLIGYILTPDNAMTALTDWKINKIMDSCDNYKLHLEQQICKDPRIKLDEYLAMAPASVADKDLQFALRKYHAVDGMTKKLQEKDNSGEVLPAETRLSNFNNSFSENKGLILENKDTLGEKLCKSISALMTQGILAALAIWKNGARQLTDEIENTSSLTVSSANQGR